MRGRVFPCIQFLKWRIGNPGPFPGSCGKHENCRSFATWLKKSIPAKKWLAFQQKYLYSTITIARTKTSGRMPHENLSGFQQSAGTFSCFGPHFQRTFISLFLRPKACITGTAAEFAVRIPGESPWN
jgi:hypothetical protein